MTIAHTHLFASVTTRDRHTDRKRRGGVLNMREKNHDHTTKKGGRNQAFGFGFIYRVYHWYKLREVCVFMYSCKRLYYMSGGYKMYKTMKEQEMDRNREEREREMSCRQSLILSLFLSWLYHHEVFNTKKYQHTSPALSLSHSLHSWTSLL